MSLFAELTASVNAVRPAVRACNFDLPLVIAASTLLLLGLLMVYSASIALADGPRYASTAAITSSSATARSSAPACWPPR